MVWAEIIGYKVDEYNSNQLQVWEYLLLQA